MKPTIVKLLIAVMALLALPASTFATNEAPAWLQDSMYASGKIVTVVIVVSAVLIGIALWMFALDRRIGKLEKEMKVK